MTWDVNSRDPAQCARLRRFVFGDSSVHGGKKYEYRGFVEQDGVTYLGQSVLFVTRERLQALQSFLQSNGIGHHVTEARLGSIVASG